MRHLTPLGWKRLKVGFSDDSLPVGNEEEFWSWAMDQGDSFLLAAYLVVGMLGGDESEFQGFNKIHGEAHPVRIAWALDGTRKAMISDFLLNSREFMM